MVIAEARRRQGGVDVHLRALQVPPHVDIAPREEQAGAGERMGVNLAGMQVMDCQWFV